MNQSCCQLKKKENRMPTILQINPRGTLPILIYNGIPLHESMAIVLFLEDQTKRTLLCSTEKRDKLARIYVRMAEFNRNFPHEIFLLCRKKTEWNVVLCKLQVEILKGELSILNDYLCEEKCKYLTGGEFTLVDIVVFPFLALCDRMGYGFEEFPNLRRYYEDLKERESIKRTWPPHWVSTPKKNQLKELMDFVNE